MNGPSAGPAERGSLILEVSLWTLLALLLLAVLNQKFLRSWRGFRRAIADQHSILRR